ncbi:uncharacterized protein LOC117326355 isoform X2 [Pecten maximus]|uniref:uncharacterized protein LOC117326355 isoform X2 n=1 Tax=Pecten maximus TaxID=6579 RepID=UPI001458EAA0|nr:uncharacterized protein LOC117326355 isoform X2 [Pecten maximus]
MAVTSGINLLYTVCVLFVGYSTGDVFQNFTCITYNWDEYLTCSWTVSMKYNSPAYTTAVDWQMLSFQRSMRCPKLTNNTCVWSLGGNGRQRDTDPFQPIQVCLYLQRHNQTKKSKCYKVDIEKKVKPDKVSDLKAKSQHPNCIFAQWTHQQIEASKMYSVELSSPGLDTIRKNLGATPSDDYYDYDYYSPEIEREAFTNITICNLSYYKNYTFSVKVRAVDMDNNQIGYWSDSQGINIVTAKSVPSAPPYLPPGGYTLSPVNSKGYRMARVYWTELPEHSWNGENLTHEVEAVPVGECGSRTIRRIVRETEAEFDIMYTCNYTIKVWTRNEIGRSKDGSILHLKQNALPKPQDVFLAEGNSPGMVHITWQEPNDIESSLTYSVYWCPRSPGLLSCKGSFNTRAGIKPIDTSGLVMADIKMDGRPNVTYMYGVSTERIRGRAVHSSGFEWTDCSITSSDKLKYPRISFEGFPSENRVRMKWMYMNCAGTMIKKSHLTHYHISKCAQETCEDLTTDGKQAHLDFNPIIAGQQICVTIRVRLDTVSGQPSKLHCYTQPLPGTHGHLGAVVVALICMSGLALVAFTLTVLIYQEETTSFL